MPTAATYTEILEQPPKAPPFDVERIRADFPILRTRVNGHPLIYFDNAATSQKPARVIDAISGFYQRVNSNVHRGVHTLSQESTDVYEDARRRVARFVGASSDREIVFTGGTTHSINLAAQAFVLSELSAGDEIVVTEIEHHSNFVPWQQACRVTGATLRVVEADSTGSLDLAKLEEALSKRTKLVAITHVSNALGTIVDLQKVVGMAHAVGVPVLADGAQAVPHLAVDVGALDVDFYAFSGHKIFGPMGIGVLYGKEQWLQKLEPPTTGGGMIDRVTRAKTTWADLPHKFEAGTPNVAGAVGLAAALDYVSELGLDTVTAHEQDLTSYMLEGLASIEDARLLGPDADRAAVFSLALGSAHPFDVGSLLDQMGIAVRTGHHCNQPLMARLGIPGTVRASLASYNSRDEIDVFIKALDKIRGILD